MLYPWPPVTSAIYYISFCQPQWVPRSFRLGLQDVSCPLSPLHSCWFNPCANLYCIDNFLFRIVGSLEAQIIFCAFWHLLAYTVVSTPGRPAKRLLESFDFASSNCCTKIAWLSLKFKCPSMSLKLSIKKFLYLLEDRYMHITNSWFMNYLVINWLVTDIEMHILEYWDNHILEKQELSF